MQTLLPRLLSLSFTLPNHYSHYHNYLHNYADHACMATQNYSLCIIIIIIYNHVFIYLIIINQDAKDKPKDLRSRGLCLVPVSCTQHVGNENGADYWAPAYGSGF